MQKTELYKNDSTELYQNSNNRTQIYDDFEAEEHGLKIGDKIELNATKYMILDIVSTNSGEAIIYMIQNFEGHLFALKLYFEFQNPKDEPNPESLRRILKITDSDLLKLHDFGTGEDKYQNRFCFEISDFAEGGDLLSVDNFQEKYSVNFLETNVIPQIFKGIQTLHRNKIFHCDLKPQNVFFQNSEQTNLVIGDYGSAKTFDFEDGKDARKTSTVKGTDFYLPPEQARGFISEKNDYYSFGMILLHLIYPEKVCNSGDYTKLSRQKLKEIIVKQFENEPIIEFDESKGRINDLIQGLTLNNVLDRWGEEEVGKWLRGEKIEKTKDKKREIFPIDLGDRMIRTEKDFVQFIEDDEEWYELLFEDKTGNQLFNRWLISIRNQSTAKEIEHLIKSYQQYGIIYLKEAIIQFFQPLRPLILENQVYDLVTSTNAKFETIRFFGRLWKGNYASEEIELYLFQYKLRLENLPSKKDRQEIWHTMKTTTSKFYPEAKTSWFSNALRRFRNTKKLLPTDNFDFWLQDVIAFLAKDNNGEIHVYYESLNEDGITCKITRSITHYLAKYNDELKLEFIDEQHFNYYNYPAIKTDENTLHFDLQEVYDLTLKNITWQLLRKNKIKFKNFDKFKEELQNANPIIWENRLKKEVAKVDIQKIEYDTITYSAPLISSANYSSEYLEEMTVLKSFFSVNYQLIYPKLYIDNQEIIINKILNDSHRSLSTLASRKGSKNTFLERPKYIDETPNFFARDTMEKEIPKIREAFANKGFLHFTANSDKVINHYVRKKLFLEFASYLVVFLPLFFWDIMTLIFGVIEGLGGYIILSLLVAILCVIPMSRNSGIPFVIGLIMMFTFWIGLNENYLYIFLMPQPFLVLILGYFGFRFKALKKYKF